MAKLKLLNRKNNLNYIFIRKVQKDFQFIKINNNNNFESEKSFFIKNTNTIYKKFSFKIRNYKHNEN
jgi:hypothetical protein